MDTIRHHFRFKKDRFPPWIHLNGGFSLPSIRKQFRSLPGASARANQSPCAMYPVNATPASTKSSPSSAVITQ